MGCDGSGGIGGKGAEDGSGVRMEAELGEASGEWATGKAEEGGICMWVVRSGWYDAHRTAALAGPGALHQIMEARER